MRVCITTAATNILTRRRDGSYRVTGPSYDFYSEYIEILGRMFSKNNSIYLTMSSDECLDRLNSNQSDFTTAMFPYFGNSIDLRIPVPFYASKISFITGFDLTRKPVRPRECASVISNLTLIEPHAYFFAALLFLSLVLVILLQTWMFVSYKRRRTNGYKMFHLKLILGEIMPVFFGTSKRFRYICLLSTILTFYLVNGFKILYKTSQIIIEEPFVVRNYQDILADETSQAYFYNPMAKVSDQFENAPKDTLRGKIWAKMLAHTRGNANSHLISGIGTANQPLKWTRLRFEEMHHKHYVMIASTVTISLIETIFCLVSADDQLFRVLTFQDPSEPEDLLGWVFAHSFADEKYVTRGSRKGTESYIVIHLLTKSAVGNEVKQFIRQLVDPSPAHYNLQELVCRNSNFGQNDIHVNGIGLKYFQSFLHCILVILFLSAGILSYEKILGKFGGRRKLKSRKRRVGLVWPYGVYYIFLDWPGGDFGRSPL